MDMTKLEVQVFKALAHPLRLKILKNVCETEACVCELHEHEEFSQSNISQHLRILKDADLVAQRKDGLNVYYTLKDPRLKEIIKIADEVILNNLKEVEAFLHQDD